jgi:hypothetical protein
MKSHHNIKCSSFILPKYRISTYVPGTLMHLSYLDRSLEMWHGRNQAVAVTAINEQQFQLSRCYRIGDPSGVFREW